MNSEKLSKIVNRLEGTNWAFISGFAVEIFTKGKRKAGNDLDILVTEPDMPILEKRFNTKAKHRQFKKQNCIIDNYGFTTKYKGIEIEITTGLPKKRREEETINKIFENKISRKYKDINVFVVPIEELIVLKASMGRDKDIKDLKLLKNCDYNLNMIKDFAKDYGSEEKILQTLKGLDFTSPRGL